MALSTERPVPSGNDAPVRDETTITHLSVLGTIPSALCGQYVRTGPNPIAASPLLDDWTAAEGMVHAITLRADRALSYRNRWIRTDAASRKLGLEPVPGLRPTIRDTSATNLIAYAGTILSLSDGALAYQLTTDLETVGRVDLAGGTRPLGAHPKTDPATGDLHLLSSPGDSSCAHHVISSGGLTRQSRAIPAPLPIHDLAITRERLLLMGDGLIGVTDRHREGRTTWMPAGVSATDRVVSAEDDGGTVVIHIVGQSLRCLTLDVATAHVDVHVLAPRPQRFARINERLAVSRPRFVYTVPAGHATSIHKHDLVASTQACHDFGAGRHPGEFLFVEDPERTASEDGGWLLGLVHDGASNRSSLVVLDAAHVAGPAVATVLIPRRVPFGLHGRRVPTFSCSLTTHEQGAHMSTIQTRPTDHVFANPPLDALVTPGPIGRIVAGSVASGLVGALVLALLIFPGAIEHVITGSALLAFATGWSLLAVLSTRMTSQPQRWAFVPAAAMAVVGSALLVLAPGDDAIRVMGWIWPTAVLALAIWIAVRARRQLQSRTRAWLLSPIVGFLALGAVGGGYETVQLSLERGAGAMPGQLYDVGGHRLHLSCTGTGSPTVVLENGLGETSPNWAWIATGLAAETRVCTYDRAGQGWSEDAAGSHDGAAVAADLHTLLARANVPGPYVLVGHSLGGAYVMTYAARYPTDFAGLVLLDATSPDSFTLLPSFPTTNAAMRRLYGVAPSLSRLGLGRLVNTSVGDTLPAPARNQAHAFANSPRDVRTTRNELVKLPTALTQAKALSDLAGKPLAVVTAGEGQQAGWATAQDRLAAMSTNSVHRVAPATHESLLADQSDAAISARAIADVVRSVRTRSPLPTS